MSFTDLLSEEYQGQLDENANQYLQFISQASSRMSRLVKGLLDYTRIGKKKELVEVNCEAVVNAIKDDLLMSITDANATLEVGQLPVIKGYETEIRLLFQNLISNAIKFRKKNKAPQVKIEAVEENGGWLFSVQDNGIGIKPEHQERIFKIFQRLHNQSDYQGTGIGLAHCRKIIELHGGEIWVESEYAIGSNFLFKIPYIK